MSSKDSNDEDALGPPRQLRIKKTETVSEDPQATFDKSYIHVARIEDVEKRREWFAECLRTLVRLKSREVIAILPDLSLPPGSARGGRTSLWMIEETVKYVKKRRCKPIIVVAPDLRHTFEQVLTGSGLGDLAKRLEAELVDAGKDTMRMRPLKHDAASGRIFNVHMSALSADGIICLPPLGTHSRTQVSLTIAALLGFLTPDDQRRVHRGDTPEEICELFKRLQPRIRGAFIDGTVGMEGHAPYDAQPIQMNLLVAGQDVLSVDAVACMIMGIEPESIDHLRLSHFAGLGNLSPDWCMHPKTRPLPMRPFAPPSDLSVMEVMIATRSTSSVLLQAGVSGLRGLQSLGQHVTQIAMGQERRK